MHKKVLKSACRLTLVVTFLGLVAALGFGAGFEFGTGLPVTTLFTSHNKDVAVPENIVVKTTEEAKQVVEEAVKGLTYDVGYNCLDYAWDSMRALSWDGQPAAIAAIIYEDGNGHALVLTATNDKNWMFLDPQTGSEVRPTPGSYWAGKKIVSVKIMVIHWVEFSDFVESPVFEVQGGRND